MSWFQPSGYVVLPWEPARALDLPDHLRCTYELILSLAHSYDGQRTPPVTRRELAAWRGLAVRTLDYHLATLRRRGLLRRDPNCDGPCLVLLPRHGAARPPRGETPGAQEAPQGVAVEPPSEREDTRPLPPSSQSERKSARPLPRSSQSERKDTRRLPRSPQSERKDARRLPHPPQSERKSARRLPPSPQGTAVEPQSVTTLLARAKAKPDTLAQSSTLDQSSALNQASTRAKALDQASTLAQASAQASTRAEASAQAPPESPPEPDKVRSRALLLEVGVYAAVAQRLAELAWVQPELIRAWVAALRRRRRVRHLGAVLAALLADPQRCLPPPEEVAPVDTRPCAAADEAEAAAGEADAWPPDDPGPPDDADPQGPRPAPALPFAWEALLDALRARLGDQIANLWLPGAYPVSYAPGRLVIALRSTFGVDFLRTSRASELNAVATALCGAPTRLLLVPTRGDGI